MSQLTQKQKAEQRRREAAERIEANRRRIAEQQQGNVPPPAGEWSSPDSPVQDEPEAPVENETDIHHQIIEDLRNERIEPEVVLSSLTNLVDDPAFRQIAGLDAPVFNDPNGRFIEPVDHVAAFTTWLRSKQGLDASDPRMPENDRARFACELDNRLRMAWMAGVASVTGGGL